MQGCGEAIVVPRSASDHAVKQFIRSRSVLRTSSSPKLGFAKEGLRRMCAPHHKKVQYASYALMRALTGENKASPLLETPYCLAAGCLWSTLTADVLVLILSMLAYELDDPHDEALVHTPRRDTAHICFLNLAQTCKWANWTMRYGIGRPLLLDATARLLSGCATARSLPSHWHFWEAVNHLRTPAITLMLAEHASGVRLEALAQYIDSCAMHCADEHCARQRDWVNAEYARTQLRLGMSPRTPEKRRLLEEWFRHIPWKAPPKMLVVQTSSARYASNEEQGCVLLSVVADNGFRVQLVRSRREHDVAELKCDKCWGVGRVLNFDAPTDPVPFLLDTQFSTAIMQGVTLSQDGRFALATLCYADVFAGTFQERHTVRAVVVWPVDLESGELSSAIEKRVKHAVRAEYAYARGQRCIHKAWFVSNGAETVAVAVAASEERRQGPPVPYGKEYTSWSICTHRLTNAKDAVLLTNDGALLDEEDTAPLPLIVASQQRLGTPCAVSQSHSGQTVAIVSRTALGPTTTCCVRMRPESFVCTHFTYGRVKCAWIDDLALRPTAVAVDPAGNRIALLLEDVQQNGTVGAFQSRVATFYVEDVHQLNWKRFKMQPFSSRTRRMLHDSDQSPLIWRVLLCEEREMIYNMDFSHCGRYITIQDKRRSSTNKGIDLGLQCIDTALAFQAGLMGPSHIHGVWATPTGKGGIGWHPRHIRMGAQCLWTVIPRGICAISFPAALR